jgi:farnesol dehydrogenase
VRILLTGGTGYLGGRLANRLREQGHGVRLLVRDVPRAKKTLGNDFEMVPGDLANPSRLGDAVKNCDAVVHTAALVRNWIRNPEEFERVNVAGSWALCEAALEAGVVIFLYTSSFFALGPSGDGQPVDESALVKPVPMRFFNAYHSTKYRAARLLQAFVSQGLPLAMVFPSVIFGPGAETDGNHVGKILRWLKEGTFPGLIGGGTQRWNLAYIDDVVEGHVKALERAESGGAYILGGEDRVLKDFAAEAALKLGVPPPKRKLPFRLCHWIASVEESKARLFHTTPRLTHGEVEIYRHDWIYSSRHAVETLNYRMTPFDTALDITIRSLEGTPG